MFQSRELYQSPHLLSPGQEGWVVNCESRDSRPRLACQQKRFPQIADVIGEQGCAGCFCRRVCVTAVMACVGGSWHTIIPGDSVLQRKVIQIGRKGCLQARQRIENNPVAINLRLLPKSIPHRRFSPDVLRMHLMLLAVCPDMFSLLVPLHRLAHIEGVLSIL